MEYHSFLMSETGDTCQLFKHIPLTVRANVQSMLELHKLAVSPSNIVKQGEARKEQRPGAACSLATEPVKYVSNQY